MNSGNSGFRSLPAQLSVAKSVPNLPFATSLLHRIGENIGGTLTLRKNSSSNPLKNGPNNVVKVQVPPQRCGIFGFCLLSFPQNERKIYKLRQLSFSQFVVFEHIAIYI